MLPLEYAEFWQLWEVKDDSPQYQKTSHISPQGRFRRTITTGKTYGQDGWNQCCKGKEATLPLENTLSSCTECPPIIGVLISPMFIQILIPRVTSKV